MFLYNVKQQYGSPYKFIFSFRIDGVFNQARDISMELNNSRTYNLV